MANTKSPSVHRRPARSRCTNCRIPSRREEARPSRMGPPQAARRRSAAPISTATLFIGIPFMLSHGPGPPVAQTRSGAAMALGRASSPPAPDRAHEEPVWVHLRWQSFSHPPVPRSWRTPTGTLVPRSPLTRSSSPGAGSNSASDTTTRISRTCRRARSAAPSGLRPTWRDYGWCWYGDPGATRPTGMAPRTGAAWRPRRCLSVLPGARALPARLRRAPR
jgi:hypothetical protein